MFSIILAVLLASAPVDLSHRIPITQDYAKAEQIAKVFHKPMILLFTGSDWDVGSQQFTKNILFAPTFYEVLKKDFVFAQVDFPEIETHETAQIVHNSELKNKHNVDSFPMLIVLDEDQNEISRTGLFSNDPEQFASHLKSLLARYHSIVHHLALPYQDIDKLKLYYADARELGAGHLMDRILERGLQSEIDPYFYLERYSTLLTEGKANETEALLLRSNILKLDPENKFGAHYRLSVLDFQSQAEHEDLKPQEVIKPLIDYIAKYGKDDTDHLWRIHMMVSQYL
ncbi:MAG: thioredoxin family protein, partial [Chlamydiia bacterium]|nr:thioredoxin family protein [Chlamydiia bacterium]